MDNQISLSDVTGFFRRHLFHILIPTVLGALTGLFLASSVKKIYVTEIDIPFKDSGAASAKAKFCNESIGFLLSQEKYRTKFLEGISKNDAAGTFYKYIFDSQQVFDLYILKKLVPKLMGGIADPAASGKECFLITCQDTMGYKLTICTRDKDNSKILIDAGVKAFNLFAPIGRDGLFVYYKQNVENLQRSAKELRKTFEAQFKDELAEFALLRNQLFSQLVKLNINHKLPTFYNLGDLGDSQQIIVSLLMGDGSDSKQVAVKKISASDREATLEIADRYYLLGYKLGRAYKGTSISQDEESLYEKIETLHPRHYAIAEMNENRDQWSYLQKNELVARDKYLWTMMSAIAGFWLGVGYVLIVLAIKMKKLS